MSSSRIYSARVECKTADIRAGGGFASIQFSFGSSALPAAMHSPENRMPFPLGVLRRLERSISTVARGKADEPFPVDGVHWTRPFLPLVKSDGLVPMLRNSFGLAVRRLPEYRIEKASLRSIFAFACHLPWLAFIIAQFKMAVNPFFKKIIHETF